ncbi:hypothetical protein [Hymenobacter sp. BT730]|uniref:alginate O-acetyltransferase AlgX-related protein n=1 Tax=Hymenobacter sp. BT730 TaxID=3063332 RepID=UPI0026DFE72F|nr:hypothetical protein [Hymenobacter sp. BT730]
MKRALFLLLLLLLLIPGLQARFHWLEETPLAGAYVQAPHPEFSVQSLLAGTYQPQLEQYLEDRIGFRSGLIRLRNQLSFSLLRVARSSDLVIGRHDVLFQPGVVNSYLGKDYLGAREIRYRVRRMQVVQQELAKRGIPFLFVMAPNKARFQPEDLPFTVGKPVKDSSNYEGFMREMKASSIQLLDLSQLLAQWKDTSRYALFPRGGTHWSGYAVALTADTLFRRMEQLGKFDLIDFHRQGPLEVRQDSVRLTDSDLSAPLNLVFDYQHYPMAYPQVVFDPLRPTQQRPNLLISGDSFTWGFMQFYPYLQTLFAPESRFWGVDGAIFSYTPNYTRTGEQLEQLDLRQQVESRQFIMMLETEHNLVYDAFINQLYELYHPITEADKKRISSIEQALIRIPAIGDSLWAEAYKQNVPPEQLLYPMARARYDHTER